MERESCCNCTLSLLLLHLALATLAMSCRVETERLVAAIGFFKRRMKMMMMVKKTVFTSIVAPAMRSSSHAGMLPKVAEKNI